MGQNTASAFTIIGYGIGYYLGGPAGGSLGAAIGGVIGGELQPNAKQQGARLDDLKAPQFAYGSAIPRLRGRYRTAGAYIWASAKREIATTTSQGKGGPGVDSTTYTYEMDALLELSDGVIKDITRVWANGELVFSTLNGTDDTSLSVSNSSEFWRDMRVYTGAATQLPDPVYEADVGSGNAPAYRGRGTVMIEGMNLGGGGQPPVLTFEVVTAGSYGMGAEAFGTQFDIIVPTNVGTASTDDQTFRVHVGQWDNTYATTAVKVYDVDVLTGESVEVGTYNVAAANAGEGQGNTDTDCMLKSSGTTGTMYTGLTGSSISLAYTENLGGADVRFSRSGTSIVVGSASFGSKVLRRYSTAGGAAVATSAALPAFVQDILIIGSTVYAVNITTGKSIYVLDLATLTLQTTLTAPNAANSNVSRLFNLDGELGLIEASATYGVYRRTSGTFVQIGTLAAAYIANACMSVGVLGNLLVAGLTFTGSPPTYRTWSAPLTIAPSTLDLADEVTALVAQAGISSSQIDVSDLAGTAVSGYAVTQVSSIRSVLELLSTAYYFECVESDKLYFRARGGASAATISINDMGAGEDGANVDDPLGLSRGNDAEIPARFSVAYVNVDNDYQTGSVDSDRIISTSAETRAVQLPIVLDPPTAKGIANTMSADARIAATSFKPAVDFTEPRLEPTDVVTLVDEDGISYRARLVRQTIQRGSMEFDAVLDDANALLSTGVTYDGYTPSITVAAPADTTLKLLDIPLLRDADDGPGIYAAVKSGGGKWPGANVLRSTDNSAFSDQGLLTNQGVIGVTTTVLATWAGAEVFDEVSSVTVNVGSGTLASYTRDEILNGTAPGYMVGSELIYARTATLVSAGIYTLTGLLRGRKGTGWAMTGHATPETFVVLQNSGLLRVGFDAALIGSTQYYKGVTVGRAADTATAQSLADTGVGLKPYAPVDLRGARATNGDMAMTWKRRTRLSTTFTGSMGSVVPLGETSEAYQVAVWDSGYTTLKRTIDASTAAATYTAEQQVADFGSIQSTIYVRVHQVSAIVGQGYALQGSLSETFASYFTPSTVNDRKAVLVGAGAAGVLQREGASGGSGAEGLYAFTIGDTSPSFTSVHAAPAATPYLPGQSLAASNPSTGAVVISLRNQGNLSAYRRLLYGNASSLTQVTPAFMPADPPAGLAFVVDKFIAITVTGEVWHSTDGGATWTDMGAKYGGPSINSDPASFQGVYMRVVDGVLVMRYQNQVFYNAALDGIDWVAATGDIASLPTGTYTNGLELYALEASDNGDAGVIIGYARDATNALFGLVYTTTDGMAWTLDFEDEIAAPTWGLKSSGLNAGMTFYSAEFLTDLWPIVGGSTSESILPIGTVGANDITFNRKASAGVATTAGVVAVGDGPAGFLANTLYSSTDTVIWSPVTWD